MANDRSGRQAVIVAHGQPSDPAEPEREISCLARKVGSLLPEWTISGVTLATPGALEAAVTRQPGAIIFPFFMSEGWFIRSALPKRLKAAGVDLPILCPFGLLDATNALAAEIVTGAATARGWEERETVLILAAHGSGRSTRSAEAVRATQSALARTTGFAEIRLGFIEQDPRLTDALRDAGKRALCLPLFVARWGHVTGDLPEALAQSGFRGDLLDPIGTHAKAPGIIADALHGRD